MSLEGRLQTVALVGRTVSKFARLLGGAFRGADGRQKFRALSRELDIFPGRPRIRRAPASDVFGRLPQISLAAFESGVWQVSVEELVTICGIVRAIGADHIFELGTYDGRTTVNLALNSKTQGQSGRVVTVDLPVGQSYYPVATTAGKLIKDLGLVDRVDQLLCDSTTEDFSRFRNSMDLVFVDAGHNYENVVVDCHTAEMVSKTSGSVVLFHDYGSIASVTRAVDELAERQLAGKFYWLQGTTLACWVRR